MRDGCLIGYLVWSGLLGRRLYLVMKLLAGFRVDYRKAFWRVYYL